MNEGKANKKCKGVKKSVVKDSITLENYKDCLFNGVTHQARFATKCITKIALPTNDNKRYIIPNDPEHRTLALGHYTINDCKDSRPETQYNKDINIRKRFLTGLQASKGAEGIEGNFQIAFITTKRKRYERVDQVTCSPPTEEAQVTLEST